MSNIVMTCSWIECSRLGILNLTPP